MIFLVVGPKTLLMSKLIGPSKQPVLTKEEAVLARRQELQKQRQREVNSQASNLHMLSGKILASGPGRSSASPHASHKINKSHGNKCHF